MMCMILLRKMTITMTKMTLPATMRLKTMTKSVYVKPPTLQTDLQAHSLDFSISTSTSQQHYHWTGTSHGLCVEAKELKMVKSRHDYYNKLKPNN